MRRPLDAHWGFRNSHGTGALYLHWPLQINQSINQSILLGQDFDSVSGRINFNPTLVSVPAKVKFRLHTRQKLSSVPATDDLKINSSDAGRTEHLSKWHWKTAWKGYNLSFCSIDASSFRIRCIFHPFPINNLSEQALLGIFHRENPTGQLSSFLFCPANVAQRSPFFLPDPPGKYRLHVCPLALDHEGEQLEWEDSCWKEKTNSGRFWAW